MPIRGGNWNNRANAGLFNLNLNNARSNANWDIGFRAAYLLLCQGAVHSRMQEGTGRARGLYPQL